MKPTHALLVMVFTLGAAARAQVVPATTAPVRPGLPISGTLSYDLRYSQTAQVSGGQDGQQWSMISGDAGYANTSKRLPFSMQYGGGYGWVWAGPPSAGNVFQHLALTQGYVGRKWNLSASDSVSYSFETPTTGFSGVPGSGEPIGTTTTTTDQTVLTQNTRSVDNTATGAFSRVLSPAMSLNIGGSTGQQRYIDGNGEDTDTLTGNAGLSRRMGARASIFGQYSFSRFNYGGAGYISVTDATPLKFTQTSSVQLGYTRQWNRQISFSVAAGPQWTSSSNSALDPSSTGVFVSASISDKFRFGTASLSYGHGVTGGSGYMPGAESDNLSANFSRDFGKNLTIGLSGAYMRTSSLINAVFEEACKGVTGICLDPVNITPVYDAKYGGVQATRKLGRHFNVFANYTATDQSTNFTYSSQYLSSSYNSNIQNGLNQVIGFGIGYSPRPVHLQK